MTDANKAETFLTFAERDAMTLNGLKKLTKGAEERVLSSGEVLVREGEPSDALYFVLSGRFGVYLADRDDPIAQIGQGQPIGEIGFFAGLARTATVKAMRDSRVLVITRERYRVLRDSVDGIQDAVIVALARRLSGLVKTSVAGSTTVKTVALLWAGGSQPSKKLIDSLRNVFGESGRAIYLSNEELARQGKLTSLADTATSDWLNSLEVDSDFVFYIADPDVTEWTKKCIRQADTVLLVANANASKELNACERFAFSVHSPQVRRLVILHEARSAVASGTDSWLGVRPVSMHHHIALQDEADIRRLYRFLSGKALGFVAGGGGARGSAHLGVYKAFREAGANFDIFGGTSSGAAMTAALAYGVDPERVDVGTDNIFVKRRALRRPTFPRYGLIDHKGFDAALQAEYGDVLIEDLWRPYFAVSCNLNDHLPRIHRSGMVWHAVRASASIPAVLPPFFTKEGEMLVDGALVDSIPLAQMHHTKTGPNVVVALDAERAGSYRVDYDSIPGRRQLLAALFNPFARRRLPKIPSILQVVALGMLTDRRQDLKLGEGDILVTPQLPADLRFVDWERHTEIFMKTYEETVAWIEKRIKEKDSRLLKLLSC